MMKLALAEPPTSPEKDQVRALLGEMLEAANAHDTDRFIAHESLVR
jgi:hypothetical protein